ncbi:uncharacterized protein LOC120083306 [Benincasa hispida]|uniref:uncharacterized protein LOC120083306 n=1 Tax=Benincasa hispida TaxID=102211 RepID=UPI0019010135|nr:uncharacterized protein LOC120083306 [Benincasa hispida]
MHLKVGCLLLFLPTLTKIPLSLSLNRLTVTSSSSSLATSLNVDQANSPSYRKDLPLSVVMRHWFWLTHNILMLDLSLRDFWITVQQLEIFSKDFGYCKEHIGRMTREIYDCAIGLVSTFLLSFMFPSYFNVLV